MWQILIKMKKETIKRIRDFTTDREWDQFHSPANLAKSISIEANELLECFQWDEENYNFEVNLFPFEQSKGHYKNIYKIVSDDKIYVLKMAKDYELEIYKFINNSTDVLPYFYGSYSYHKKDYILIEYIDGMSCLKMDRKTLLQVVDAIISIQKKYWMCGYDFAFGFDKAFTRLENRLNYLPEELKDTYRQFLDVYKNTPRTFSHEDLLPFNLIVKKDRVCFIDLEKRGILPYPTMIARLIAHTVEDEKALFYLSKEDYNLAIKYYYDHFISEFGIKESDYMNTMNLFIYNELIEWIYVYQKNKYSQNGFYDGYYQRAIDKRNEICSLYTKNN